jgi:energy-coupling factor transporter transmembrane protein EcfT
MIYFIKNRFSPKNIFLRIHVLNFFLFLTAFSFLNSFRHAHYYGLIYYSFYFIVAYFIYSFIKKSAYKVPVLIVLLALYLFLNAPHYSFLYHEGNNQIEKAKTVAESIIKSNPLSPYQVVGLPYTESVGNVRYFLEIEGHRPLSEESVDVPRELYVLCKLMECNVLNDPQWQIAAFTNKKLAGKWKADEYIIYKLVHGK